MKLKLIFILIALLFSTSFKIKTKEYNFEEINKELEEIKLDLDKINQNLNYLESQDSLRNNLK